MKLIISDEQIKALMPNVIQFTKSETTPLSKLAPYIDSAEKWLASEFTSEQVFLMICDERTDCATRSAACRAVVAEALIDAIPALDVVMTANGFAVTSTQNLTPASRQRVDTLIKSLTAERDAAIDILLHRLHIIEEWRQTEQAEWFGATLFPNFAIVKTVDVATGSLWERYQQIRAEIVAIESELAYSWVSPEMMDALRTKNRDNTLCDVQKHVVCMLQAQERGMLNGKPVNDRAMNDIVNIIRSQPWAFAEWHDSETARLFDPPVFKNDKKASGYFF